MWKHFRHTHDMDSLWRIIECMSCIDLITPVQIDQEILNMGGGWVEVNLES